MMRTGFPILWLASACEPAGQPPLEPLFYDTIGDTLLAREQVPTEWVSPRGLELDVIVGGVEAGGAIILGLVSDIVVEPAGTILVEDAQGNSVIRFGVDGSFADSIGRRGEGPGEYLAPRGIAVLPDGRIAVRDNRLFVIHVFDSAGGYIGRWPLRELLRKSWDLEADQDGTLAVRASFSDAQPFLPEDQGFVVLSPDGGVADSIPPPATPWDGEEVWEGFFFHPKKYFERHSTSLAVVGVSNGYHFDIHRPDYVLRVQQPYEPVAVSTEERAAFDVEMAWRESRGSRGLENIPLPPRQKAAYSRIMVTRTGEIWVFRHGEGEEWTTQNLGGGLIYPRFREPLQIDVFNQDGRFLGVVEGEANIDPRVVSSDTVWAVVTGEFDEEHVARFLVR
jgi:hypothetical protein